ncbi:hypothetical protein OQH61_02545 [Helicobacter sp. MIT 21-1697]|uniref:pyridoxamine 5'-phosphate oxidase family protein n=1 Tax=Helicobacter sp. MIT 21-1697 TaxID=2993733 RepID=UPI00224B4963|nr:hypothetical protein [Helicobacter sp. MIT 21-1697]MCX2716610.1 hypothetical protein [Helicobacter sp. MIT 21-1697]
MESLTLTEIGKILDLGVLYLATKGTCGNPRVRPIISHILHNGKIYFGTSKNKNLCKHIEQHAGVEICISTADILSLRIRGEARIVNHLDAKEALMAKYERVAQIFDNNPAHPHFAIFYLENISARLQDFSGNTLLYRD